MNVIKRIFGTKAAKVWGIVTPVVIALLIAASIVLTTILPGLMDWVFGGESSTVTGAVEAKYTPSEGVTDKETALAAAKALNDKVNEEGIILLKNDNSLPIPTDAASKPRISVFGKNSVKLAYGSSGSVGGDISDAPTIYDSLAAAGYECNPQLKAFYENNSLSGDGRPAAPSMLNGGSVISGFSTGETDTKAYGADVIASFKDYNDAALVVITRVSGENYDLPTTMYEYDDKTGGNKVVSGAASVDDHYLELDQYEQDMLKLACENFDNVILVLNSGTPVELGFLDGNSAGDSTMNSYDYASRVKGALWIGLPGKDGIYALGKVLNGTVNPSGRTTDTYARDFMASPAVVNFGASEKYSDQYIGQNEYFVDYEEGIYVGYRYYETRGAQDEEWYADNVIYPFGYGLSYTRFSQKITDTNIAEKSSWTKDTRDLSVTVSVTNDGEVAGKDVIQVYAHAPYYAGEIEKSEVVLVGFAKTDIIQPDETKTYKITFDPYDFASYDYSGANGARNGADFRGYELDPGEYVFSVRSDAHTVLDSISTELEGGVTFANDSVTGYPVVNRFDDVDDQLGSVLSRDDWEGTWPAFRTDEEKNIAGYEGFSAALAGTDSGNPLTADSQIVRETNAKRTPAKTRNPEGMQLYELIGVDYDDEKWDEMLGRITVSTIYDTLSDAAFKTILLDYIGKRDTIETDGPAGFTKFYGDTEKIYDTYFYASECLLAATWNTQLAYEFGISIGDEGLIGYEKKDQPYSGIYAPAVNIHRTPFGGRNPEYYSEDGFLSGAMAAQVTAGAAERGVYTYVKHFAVNDQETHRGGICTWLTEQSMREIYLKPFEKAVKDGGTTAIMSSFNRIGSKWTGGDYRLLTEVLRNEWGFKGTVICDFASGQGHMNFKQQIYAGGDLWLDTIKPSNWIDQNNPLDIYVAQNAMKNVLYTVANSNALNGVGEGSGLISRMATWRILLIVADVVIPVGLIVWGVFVIRASLKKTKNGNISVVSVENEEKE